MPANRTRDIGERKLQLHAAQWQWNMHIGAELHWAPGSGDRTLPPSRVSVAISEQQLSAVVVELQ